MKKTLILLLVALLMVAVQFTPLAQAAFAQTIPAAQDASPANWYEVFVYSYQDSDGDGIGDLNGLSQRLPYITQMGFDGLWLMPIMPSPSYHKYDVTDYCAVDPLYGTVDDLKALVAQCHQAGVRVILDLPINHTSTQHPWFQAAAAALREGDEENPYVGYYCFSREAGLKKTALEGTGWFYEEQFSGGDMPDLNLDNPAVVGEIERILSFWLEECDVDGFRLDAVTSYYAGSTEKNVAFLSRLKAIAEAIKPGSYLVGEAWTGLTEIARYYGSDLDSFFLFPASQAEGYVARSLLSRKPASSYIGYLEQVEQAISSGVLAPFLSNHDTGRAVGALQARKLPDRLKFAHAALAVMGGNTFTYYGEEIGMAGSGDDPNKRTAMYWNDEEMTLQPPGVTKAEYPYPCVDEQLADPGSLLNYIRALNEMKKQVPAIARGAHATVYYDNFLCLLRRDWQSESVYIAMNFSSSQTLSLDLPEELASPAILYDLETGSEACALDAAHRSVCLPPYAVVVISHS